jgi:hypothetical protein
MDAKLALDLNKLENSLKQRLFELNNQWYARGNLLLKNQPSPPQKQATLNEHLAYFFKIQEFILNFMQWLDDKSSSRDDIRALINDVTYHCEIALMRLFNLSDGDIDEGQTLFERFFDSFEYGEAFRAERGRLLYALIIERDDTHLLTLKEIVLDQKDLLDTLTEFVSFFNESLKSNIRKILAEAQNAPVSQKETRAMIVSYFQKNFGKAPTKQDFQLIKPHLLKISHRLIPNAAELDDAIRDAIQYSPVIIRSSSSVPISPTSSTKPSSSFSRSTYTRKHFEELFRNFIRVFFDWFKKNVLSTKLQSHQQLLLETRILHERANLVVKSPSQRLEDFEIRLKEWFEEFRIFFGFMVDENVFLASSKQTLIYLQNFASSEVILMRKAIQNMDDELFLTSLQELIKRFNEGSFDIRLDSSHVRYVDFEDPIMNDDDDAAEFTSHADYFRDQDSIIV